MQNEVIYANIIIDDPLLREDYGFLNYRKLLNLMDKHNFFSTIAFIPWNYKRTDKKIAALFKERPDRFSLCVHGCDHTKGEFGVTDINSLDCKIKLATARMVKHEEITGIPFDRIMVFPQGIFSEEALEALKLNNYIAAINTVPLPVSGSIPSSFPFWVRYTPEDLMTDVSTNPIFIVLHHDYFKHGYEKLTDFVDELNEKYKIKWDSPGRIIQSSTPELNSEQDYVDLSGLKFHGYKENFKILMRRYASELRDNYLSKNDYILGFAKSVKNLMKI
jgi:hypothetical protein